MSIEHARAGYANAPAADHYDIEIESQEALDDTNTVLPTMNGPVLLATPEEIDSARVRCAQSNEPNEAWEKTSKRANDALTIDLNYDPNKVSDFDGPRTDDSSFYAQSMRAGAYARDLAFAYQMTGRTEYAEKARNILMSWAECQTPYANNDKNFVDGGLFLARVATNFCYSYSLIHDSLSSSEQTHLNETYTGWAGYIKSSLQLWINKDYMGQQDYQNHMSAMDLGLLAIGRMTDNNALVTYAIDSPENPRDAKEMIQGAIYMVGDPIDRRDPAAQPGSEAPAPQSGEIYDRYRTVNDGKGMGYSLMHLEILMRVATMAKNSGTDLFAYTAPTGENLQVALDFYAEFMRTRDPSVNGGFYKNEPYAHYWSDRYLSMYETGHAEYSDSQKIDAALTNGGIRSNENDPEVYGYTERLLRGE